MPRIFISYRHDDSSGYAGRLHDALIRCYGSDKVFMDITNLEAGTDFVDAIEAAIGACDVVLALIGPHWLRRVDLRRRRSTVATRDWVDVEIEFALNRNIRVIPVLVQGAKMPAETELPESLVKLSRRQAHDLSDGRWDYDVEQLIQRLRTRPVGASPVSETRRGSDSARGVSSGFVSTMRHPLALVTVVALISLVASISLAVTVITRSSPSAATPTSIITVAGARSPASPVLTQVVTSYYNALNEHRFGDAYGMLSTAAQVAQSLDAFEKPFAGLRSVTVYSIEAAGSADPSPDARSAYVVAHTKVIYPGPNGGDAATCSSIQWHLVLQSGQWKRDSITTQPEPCPSV